MFRKMQIREMVTNVIEVNEESQRSCQDTLGHHLNVWSVTWGYLWPSPGEDSEAGPSSYIVYGKFKGNVCL